MWSEQSVVALGNCGLNYWRSILWPNTLPPMTQLPPCVGIWIHSCKIAYLVYWVIDIHLNTIITRNCLSSRSVFIKKCLTSTIKSWFLRTVVPNHLNSYWLLVNFAHWTQNLTFNWILLKTEHNSISDTLFIARENILGYWKALRLFML